MSEAKGKDGGCVHGGAVIGEDVGSGIINVLASLGSWGATRSYDFACPTKQGEAYYVGGGVLWRRWRQK